MNKIAYTVDLDDTKKLIKAQKALQRATAMGWPSAVAFSSVLAIVNDPWQENSPVDIHKNIKILHKSSNTPWSIFSMDLVKTPANKAYKVTEDDLTKTTLSRGPYSILANPNDYFDDIEFNLLSNTTKQKFNHPNIIKEYFGNLAFIRLPIKNNHNYNQKILNKTPSHSVGQFFTFKGHKSAYQLETGLLDSIKTKHNKKRWALITSGNHHGDPEITHREMDRMHTFHEANSDIMPLLIVNGDGSNFRNLSFPVVVFEKDHVVLERGGNLPLEITKKLYADIPNFKISKIALHEKRTPDRPSQKIINYLENKTNLNPKILRNVIRKYTQKHLTYDDVDKIIQQTK